jgi:hypothetical protein
MFALKQFTVYISIVGKRDSGETYTTSSSKKIFALDEASALRDVNQWIKESGYVKNCMVSAEAMPGSAHFDQDILYAEESLASIITYLTRPVAPEPPRPQAPSALFEERLT